MRLASILFVLALSAVSRVSHAQGEPVPLRPGDRVFVRVAADSVWDDSLTVDTDEKIFLPHVGAVSIRGVPATQVGAAVRRALAVVYRTEDATVVPLRRVTVTGEVKKTGTYFLPIESTLRDAVAVTEGVTDIGNQDRLVLVRGDSTTRLRHWLTTAAGGQLVASGDVLIIDRDPWIKRNALAAISTLSILVTTIVAVTR